jgi:integrase
MADYALRDVTTAIVYRLLSDVTRAYSLNVETVGKICSILFGMFNYAICTGELPDGAKNPVEGVILPESATQPEPTEAATREEVQALLTALKGQPLARAAVSILSFCGVRPGEARGLRWEDWDRAEKQFHVCRSVWHRIVSTPKNQQSIRFVTVPDELREILLDLWKAKNSPIGGYILAGRKDWPVILDNLTKRVIRPAAEKAGITWKECYALRRFHGTEVRVKSDGKTAAEALGNSEEVFDKHYKKLRAVTPDVRRAVNEAMTGLVQ